MQNRHPIIAKIFELAAVKETPETIKQTERLINTALKLAKIVEEEARIIQSEFNDTPSLTPTLLPPPIKFDFDSKQDRTESPLAIAIKNGNLTIASLLSKVTESHTDAIFAALEKGYISLASALSATRLQLCLESKKECFPFKVKL